MDNRTYMYEEEKEIDLVGLLAYVIRQWKKLVIVLVIGAILGVGLCFITKPDPVEVEHEKEKFLANLNQIYRYQQMYDNQVAYRNNSVYLHMDPNNLYSGSLQYYMYAGNDTEYIGQLFNARLNSETVRDEIKQTMGLECGDQYACELFGADFSQYQDSTGNIINITSDNANNTAFKRIIVSCWVTFDDEDMCRSVLDVYENKIKEISEECAQEFEGYVVRPLKSQVTAIRDTNLADKQQEFVSTIDGYRANIEAIKEDLDEAEIAYYEAVYVYPGEMEVPELFSTELGLMSFIKWIIIGMFLGGFCWAGYYMVKYLLSDSLANTDELKKYGIQLIGFLKKEEAGKKDVFCALADSIERASDMPLNDAAYVKASVEMLEQKSVVLCGDETSRKAASAVSEGLALAKTEGFLHSSYQALAQAQGADGVILLLEKNRSKHSEIKRELEVCRLHGIKMLGAIVIG